MESGPALLLDPSNVQLVLEVAPAPIFVHQGGVLLYLNPAALNCLGYERRSELLGAKVLDKLVHPDDAALVARRIDALSESERLPADLVRFRRRDGSYAVLEAAAAKIDLADRDAIVVTARDVTLEQEFRSRLQALFEVTAELVGGISEESVAAGSRE